MLKAIIIDDESAAIGALRLLVGKHIEDVQIIGSTTECYPGIEMIEQLKPDIVFLDVSMPDMSGFTLLKKLEYQGFNLVFTTAHERYALQAIKHHPSDYLLKPIDVDELRVAIDSVKEARKGQRRNGERSAQQKTAFTGKIPLPVKEGVVYLDVSDVIWVESDGNYCTFHMADTKKYVVAKNLGEYEDMLPGAEFFRAHKSHLINVRKVKKYIRANGYFVEMDGGPRLEIARRKKEDFLRLMNGHQ